MKAYRLEVLVVDHDDIGLEGVLDALENARFPNRCIVPRVMGSQEADIGVWHDDHPFNFGGAVGRAAYEQTFFGGNK